MPSLDVALVATLPDGDENLALAYLATALRQAGHSPQVITFRNYHDLEDAARRVCALSPPLLGLSIPSGHAAIDILAFLHRVRTLGYQGHVTCGGAYATLARSRLLQVHQELDSVIRHDGELPLVSLANALAERQSVAPLAGVTTRQGDGAPAPVDDSAGLLMMPEREPARFYAGVPCAKLSAVRGCWGGCRYCGLAGLRREALREARSRGLSCEAARRAGVGAMRRRPVQHVAEEMHRLYRDRGVRYFHFVDENHLPRDPEQACSVLADLQEALEQRGVKNRALSLMLRADIATRKVVDSLARLGVVRCLLGVESNTQDGLDSLGRNANVEANQEAVRNLQRHGISFHLNVLLLHPSSKMAAIEREVASLQGLVEGGLLDPFQVEILEGTDLFEQVRKTAQLRGGPHLWHFWPEEAAARRFAEVFFALKRQVLGRQQLTAYAYEVLGTLAVAHKLGLLGSASPRLAREAHCQIVAHNRLWNDLLEETVRLAYDPHPERYEALLKEGSVRAAALTLGFARLSRDVQRAADRPLRTDVHYPRTGTAVTLAASLLAAACGGVTASESRVGDASPAVDAAAEVGTDASSDAPADKQDTATCDLSVAKSELAALRQEAAACPQVCVPPTKDFQYRFLLDATGHVIDMERDDGLEISADLKQCYLAATAGQVFPCLAKEPVWVQCSVALK